MTIRERTEQNESQQLSEYAMLASQSKGRMREEPKCDIRTDYQRDRDRILHCNAFKRLRHKTQVFLTPNRDHYRTRLVHTLEVSQIARTIARGLQLNEDLTEAIALGHDLGHTPFGHAGEAVLNRICPDGFKHAKNSVRMVTALEKEGRGLNLTHETLDGIACHTDGIAQTLEGRVVKISDKVAYINHDIEDAIRADVLKPEDLPGECVRILGDSKSKRITTIVLSLLEHSSDDIRMAEEIQQAHDTLREFMFERVYYTAPSKKEQEKKAAHVVETMYRYYMEHEENLPALFQRIAKEQGLHQGVCDYISGMTDNYIVEQYMTIFVPNYRIM